MLTHTFVSAKADGADATLIRPGNWNAEHKFDGGSNGQYLKRDSGDPNGAVWATAGEAPTGALIPYAGGSAPAGWLLCDGSQVSRTTYAALFAVIGVTYGNGNGTSTFTLPDMRGRTPIGVGQGTGLTNRTLADTGGEEAHALTAAEGPIHNHGINDPTHTHTISMTGTTAGSGSPQTSSGGGAGGSGAYTDVTNGAATGITVQNAGSGAAHNTMQPFLAVNFLIKI